MPIILSFDALFVILLFIMNFESYRKLFKITFSLSFCVWIFITLLIRIYSINLGLEFWILFDILVIIAFSMAAPILILYAFHHIKIYTSKFENAKLFNKYHIHEGFFGIISIIISIFLFLFRNYLLDFEIFKQGFNFFITTINIIIFTFLFIGGFLIVRDWNDISKFKLIEIKNNNIKYDEKLSTSVFQKIGKEDLHFFNMTPIKIYPIGIILLSLSISAVVHENSLLPQEIFLLTSENVKILGFILGFIAGSILGKDWLRIFRRFYPDNFREIEKAINQLKAKYDDN
ncbi:MAG: hypothetical protein ACTSQP_04900 [Promethearchaeota archaeon]